MSIILAFFQLFNQERVKWGLSKTTSMPDSENRETMYSKAAWFKVPLCSGLLTPYLILSTTVTFSHSDFLLGPSTPIY